MTFAPQLSSRLLNWLFCAPCIHFLKTSTTFHKMTLTGVTLLVTSLLVASPILFLISAAPSIPQREGCVAQDDCLISLPPPECQEPICKNVATGIQAKINWKVDVCKDFKSFSCAEKHSSLRIMRSSQEIADHQMLRESSFSPSLRLICHPPTGAEIAVFAVPRALERHSIEGTKNTPKTTDEAVPVPSFVSSPAVSHPAILFAPRHENINFIHSALHCSQFPRLFISSVFCLPSLSQTRSGFLLFLLKNSSPFHFPFN